MWADLVCVRDGEDDSVEEFELLDVVLGQIPKNNAAAAQQVGDEQVRGVRLDEPARSQGRWQTG